jgi:hypothetical protein
VRYWKAPVGRVEGACCRASSKPCDLIAPTSTSSGPLGGWPGWRGVEVTPAQYCQRFSSHDKQLSGEALSE